MEWKASIYCTLQGLVHSKILIVADERRCFHMPNFVQLLLYMLCGESSLLASFPL